MSRRALLPVLAFAVAAVAGTALVVLQHRVTTSRDAQLSLVRLDNELNELQARPWQVENPRAGTPQQIRAEVRRSERSIDAILERLRPGGPTELAGVQRPIRQNYAALDAIMKMGQQRTGWRQAGPTGKLSQAQRVSLASATALLEAAGRSYEERARAAELTAMLGGAGAIALLFAAFVYYHRRSVRSARAQGQALAVLNHAQEDRRRLLARTVEIAEEERIRLAVELHDGPIQQLTALALNLDLVGRRIERGDVGGIQTAMAGVRQSLSVEMNSLRRLMVELRPPVLDERGLAAALEDAAGELLKATPVTWEVRCDVERQQLAPELETAIYRVAREALVNVRKHAEATTVSIAVERVGRGLLRLTVADDGRGFDMQDGSGPAEGRRYGILGMEERVKGVGGTLEIHSKPGAGTSVRAHLPLKTRAVEEVIEHQRTAA